MNNFTSEEVQTIKFFLEERYKDNDIYLDFIKETKKKEDVRDTVKEQCVLESILEKIQKY